jgi:GNAT superfamily N-acetyltransferase
MSFSIRPAGPADAGTVLALIKALATYERMLEAVEMDAHLLEEALQAGHCRALLAFDEAVAVGVALYFFNFSTWTGKRGLYLEDLFVVPEARKQGLGLAFFRRLAAIAIAEGCLRMEWQVLEWNELAHGFYRGLGAAPMTEWRVWRLETGPMENLAWGDSA